MPPRRESDSLEHLCFVVVATMIHELAVELEEKPNACIIPKENLSSMIQSLPSIINERIIVIVIQSIHQTISRTRITIGLVTCLEVLLQPHIQKLDISELFNSRMRVTSTVNTRIQNIVKIKVPFMHNLRSIHMASRCTDEILVGLSKNCPHVDEIVIYLSDLVTDTGIIATSSGLPKLEKLGIYKCWEVSKVGIKYALSHSNNLQELQCEQLGSVLISQFKKSNKVFKLTTFEQTQNMFEPTLEEVKWVGKTCKDLTSARLFVEDSTLHRIHHLGKLKSLELDINDAPGEGLRSSIIHLGEQLTALQLSCDSISQEHLTLIGSNCIHLTSLHITTASIEDDEKLRNTGNLFPSLTMLHIYVWKESYSSAECLEFFLFWCRNLVSVYFKAETEFMTDRYLRNLLQINPMQCATRIVLASDKFVPLTLASAYLCISSCPKLENLSISSWDVSEEEFFEIIAYVKKNNFKLTLS